jgi:hypothetical protein
MNARGRGNNNMETVYSARSASSMGTRQIVAGIGLKKITSPSLDTVQLLPPLLTRWIPTDMPTQELLTISLVSWTNLPCVTSIMSERRCTQPTVRVWRLVMLVSLLFTPHLENLNYLTFFMSHKQQKISCVFIISLWIIMSFLKFTIGSSLSRIRTQGTHSLEEDAEMDCTLYQHHHTPSSSPSELISHLLLGGMIV